MGEDATTISLFDGGRGAHAEPAPERVGLLIAWSTSEPSRIGEVALVEPGSSVTLGRGEGAAGPRATFVRQRPGMNEPAGPLGGLGLSRDQLRVVASADVLEIERLGKRPVELRGVEVDRATLRPGDALLVRGQLALLCVKRPAVMPGRRTFPLSACGTFGAPDMLGMIGESPAAWRLRDDVAFAAEAGAHVLFLGESGTGKELAARAIHRLSTRRDHPFVARNAATIPAGLIDAELFGHARNYPNPGMGERAGLIGDAHGGVLFLDEIAELPLDLQSHLLRVLDAGGEYQRLGDSTSRRSDFVLVGATNRDPSILKQDLLARFALRVNVPSLRARAADIPLFVRHLLARAAEKSPKLVERFVADGVHVRVAPRFVVDLLGRAYPTNVRELDGILWRAIAASDGDAITSAPDAPEERAESHSEPTADAIRAALAAQDGSVTRAAAALGLPSRFALYRLMKRLGLGDA